MPARVVRVIRVAVRYQQLVSGQAAIQAGEELGLDWLLHKQRAGIWSGSIVLQQGQDLGSTALPSRKRAVAA